MWTDDPVRDAARYDAEQQAKLEKNPRCDYCNEYIQTDTYYEIDGQVICEECLERHFKKFTEDYIA